jgi:hypothetical protein
MSVNGDHPTVEDVLFLEDPILEPEGLHSSPPSQQSIVQHYAFLKKLRVLHYLGNLYATRVVPAFEQWERLRQEAVDWVKAENERRESRCTANERERGELRGQRDDLQRDLEKTEITYAQAHTQSQAQEKVSSTPFPGMGSRSDEADSRGRRWARALAAMGAKVSPYLSDLAAVICGSVLGSCGGGILGIV